MQRLAHTTFLVASIVLSTFALALPLASVAHADPGPGVHGGFCDNNGKHEGWDREKWAYMYRHCHHCN